MNIVRTGLVLQLAGVRVVGGLGAVRAADRAELPARRAAVEEGRLARREVDLRAGHVDLHAHDRPALHVEPGDGLVAVLALLLLERLGRRLGELAAGRRAVLLVERAQEALGRRAGLV